MTETSSFDVFSSLDGHGSNGPPGDGGAYWGKQGPEPLEHRMRALPAYVVSSTLAT